MAANQSIESTGVEIEAAAVEFARGAGNLLAGHFGRALSVEYKDKAQQDPVTVADKETQAYLVDQITRRFPEHGILGEEDDASADGERSAADYLWVLDPLDGTTNFMNGLPVYASSIGVLYRGRPLAGAVYIPWPSATSSGVVVHCHAGGGAFADGEPVSVYEAEKPRGDRLIGLPGSFGASTRVGKGLKGQPLGQLRVTGSIAYELAMTALGVMQFAVIGAPRMWDMLGGAVAVQEAGGTVMTRLSGRKQWHPLESLVPTWDEQASYHGGVAQVGRAAGGRESHPGPADRPQSAHTPPSVAPHVPGHQKSPGRNEVSTRQLQHHSASSCQFVTA